MLRVCADPGPLSISFSYPGVPGFETTWAASGNKSWWTTGLPVGNGKLAAMIAGGVGTDLLQFNEDTIWTGQPHNYANPASTPAHLQSIRNKCFNGQDILSEATTYLLATPSRLPEFMCAGGVRLIVPHGSFTSYRRSLNLSNATVNVSYVNGGVTYNREIFASAPSNRVIVVRFTASQPSSIAFTCALTNLHTATYSTVNYGGNAADVIMHANVSSKGDERYFTTPPLGLTNAVKYDARVRLVATGGTVTAGPGSVSVTNADEVTLFLSVVSNVKSYNDVTADYVTICSNNVAQAAAMGYGSVRSAQQEDYTNLFNRVVLDLGHDPAKTSNDLGLRRKTMSSDPTDFNLVTLFFQLGRYLMISGSRPGSEPLTLQGKWNDATNGYNLWGMKMTLNINQEMNYWGAEVANLSECAEPLFDLIKDLSESGHKVALSNYFCTSTNAWVAHHNTDLWRNAGPVNGWDGYWTAGGAWLCQHLWWHYQYTGDTNWLAEIGYPLMKGAAQFFKETLVPIPPTSIYYNATSANWLVTCPSMSPEHSDPAGHANYPGPTMDNDIIRELFKNVIAASEILDDDFSFRTNIMALRDRLPPDTVGNFGQLKEFLNYEDNDAGHRHCSGLVGLSPGEVISPFYTPIIARAASVSVAFKGDPGTDTPWSRAVRLNLHTRLHDGEGAFVSLTNILAGSKISTNLMFGDGDNGSKRQIDFIMGSLAGIAEMFLQSHADDLHLLPAVPSRFTNGMVSGLCARGGFQVDNLSWTNGRLAGATIVSKLGNTCRLRSKWPIDVKLGENYVDAPMVAPGLYEFSTIAESNYTIVAATVFETENLTATTSAGDTHQTLTNAAYSNWRGTRLNANAATDFVSYVLPNVEAGSYRVRIFADAGTNCGQFQLSCGPAGGSLSDVGSQQDTYSPTNLMYLLPIRINTTTNVIRLWTNQLTEYDCGTWVAPSSGNYEFKFTVAGKNAGSSGYNLSFDHIKLTPENSAPPSNNAPTDISLPSGTIFENEPSGTTVGAFSTTDPDAGDTFTYTLVNGVGDTDNAAFAIVDNELRTATVLDYETQNSLSIRVRGTDQGGLFVEKSFAVTVLDTNEAPTDLFLTSSNVLENLPAGTVVDTLSTSDPDAGDSFNYALATGGGDEGNSFFTVEGDTLKTAAALDHETQNPLSIRLSSTDAGGLSVERIVAIAVGDVNEPPNTPANLFPSDGAADQSLTLTLQASAFSDPDAGALHSASQWLIRRASDDSLVFDSGEDAENKSSIVVPAGTLSFSTVYKWQNRQQDNFGLWSDYSAQTTFSTLAPALTAMARGNELVLFWPTNADDFVLQYSTNLASMDWFAGPAPTLVDGLNVVTNAMSEESALFRLQKP